MSRIKEHFDDYMDMILSSGKNNDDDSSLNFEDFDDIEEDEKLNICQDIFSAKYASETEDISNDSWRDEYENNLDCDIDPYDYDNEEEYLEALEETKLNANIPIVSNICSIKADKKSNANYDRREIYSYCKVLIEASNKQSVYLSGKIDLDVGDKVVVPDERDNTEIIGIVIAVGKCFDFAFPCDLSDIKTVIKLLNKNDSSKELSNNNNLVYEDNYIKISLAKWIHKNYFVGGEARTGTFIFENKYSKRFCIYFKDISVEGFLNQAESFSIALSGKQKELKEMPFVYEDRIPECSKEYRTIEFKVCYGTIKDGINAIPLINKPVIESDVISIKV